MSDPTLRTRTMARLAMRLSQELLDYASSLAGDQYDDARREGIEQEAREYNELADRLDKIAARIDTGLVNTRIHKDHIPVVEATIADESHQITDVLVRLTATVMKEIE